MTGTADTEAEEFRKIYNLDVVVVPTNVPMIRDDQADVIYKSLEAKHQAIVNLIKELHQKGQPVLVGTISIERSEQISTHLRREGIPHEVLNAKQHAKEAEIIVRAGHKGSVTIATNMAGRGTDIKLTPETKSFGLFILGTERHESRRIDNQLRGRSGRQGDPGASKFFLSLEDDLMRIFGSDRIKGIMHSLGMKDDEPIEHRMITNAIAKAQKKVEAHNFEIRKHLLEYDNVMNEQRRVIYRIRRDILGDQDNFGFIKEMVEDVALECINAHAPERKTSIEMWDWESLSKGFAAFFHTDRKISLQECQTSFESDINHYLINRAQDVLQEKFAKYEAEQISMAIREILLSIFDQHWKDHLLAMDHMKEGINLRAYAQKDPLTEYKRESFNLFEEMRKTVKRAVVEQIFTVQLYTKSEIEELHRRHQAEVEAQLEAHKLAQREAQQREELGAKASAGPAPQRRVTQKVGRNDPCPCGSGKKFKQCHGA
jgi:preprotein translocase subunit SecA